jgi:hypothetical protein
MENNNKFGDRSLLPHPKQRSPFVITKNDRHSRKTDSPKMIALSQAKMRAVLNFNQEDDGDRTLKPNQFISSW